MISEETLDSQNTLNSTCKDAIKKKLVIKKIKTPIEMNRNKREATVQIATIKPPHDFIFYFLFFVICKSHVPKLQDKIKMIKAEKLFLQSLVSLFKLIGNISRCLLKSCKCNVATPSLLSNTYLYHQNHLQYLIQQGMKWKVELLDTLISSLVPSTSVSAHHQKTTVHKGPNPVKK